jgi:hypothetical protein
VSGYGDGCRARFRFPREDRHAGCERRYLCSPPDCLFFAECIVFQAPNNPRHHPDPSIGSFFDPQFRQANSGEESRWPVDHARSLPRPGSEVLAEQAHAGGEWPTSGGL